jgi:hypothetical protein
MVRLDNLSYRCVMKDRSTAAAIKDVILGSSLVVVLGLVMYRFALLGRKTLFSGDSIIFGLPLFDLRARVIHHGASMVWRAGIYGGHPLFAEGQAAFMGLLPMVLAAVVTPIAGAVYTLNLFAFLCLVATGAGVVALCQKLGFGLWASAFAGLAVAFSPACLDMQTNAVISGSFLWIPWCLLALEHWLERPSLVSAAIMGAVMACLILAGYPQAFHGTVVYIAVRLVAGLCASHAWEGWPAVWRKRLATSLLAASICAGLAAVQLLPLVELAGLSHRQDGTGLVFQAPSMHFYRGLLYTLNWRPDRASEPPGAGSLLVCVLASLVIFFNRSSRVVGHLLAGIFLTELGIGWFSPLFHFLYTHDLLPGLHYFRTMYLYYDIGVIGIAVSAAGVIDAIASRHGRAPVLSDPRALAWGLPGAAILWGAALISLKTPDAPIFQVVVLITAVAGTLFLAVRRHYNFVPMLLAGLLFTECAVLRAQPFRMVATSNLATPESVEAIQSTPHWFDYRFVDEGLGILQAYLDSRDDKAIAELHRMLAAVSGLTPDMWGIDGMNGALALPLARRMLAQPLIDDEINDKTAAKPGDRLIDVLAIRFIGVDWLYSTPALKPFWHKPDLRWIMENTAALPRFQTYSRHVSADSTQAALSVIRNWKERTLVIENPPGPQHQEEAPDEPVDSADAAQQATTLMVEFAGDTSYRLKVTGARATWVFLADAHYPGWTASLDGQPVPVFAAQVLGKAVRVPAGNHDLTIEFHSATFRLGAWISLISLVATALFAISGHWRTRRMT